MLGRPNPDLRQVTVVGAGISGLLLAYDLDRRGFEVTLIDAASHVGGLIRTQHTENGIVETAAHSFLASPRVRELCSELGVDLVPVNQQARARYVWRSGRMNRFPLRPWEVLVVVARALMALAPRTTPPEQLTLDQWARRFLGNAATDYLLNPFLRGIYAARPSELAVASAFPSLTVPQGHSLASLWIARNITKRVPKALTVGARYGKGPRPMMAPKSGMGALVDALEARLRSRLGGRFRLSEKIDTLPVGAGKDFNIALCVPAAEAARLLESEAPDLSRQLKAVKYTPLITATVFAKTTAFANGAPRGVGVLVPEKERDRKCLGILFNSSAFPNRTRGESVQSFTMMLGGTSRPEVLDLSNDELRDVITSEMKAVLKMKGDAEAIHITRWPRAIPVYGPNLQSLFKNAETGWCAEPGRMIFGNYAGQVSMRGLIESLA